MIMKAFSVLDQKAEAFLPLFFARSQGEALRSLSDAVNDPKHQFYKHAADYQLYSIGTWDDQAGTFNFDQKHVCAVRDLLESSERV